MRLKRIQKFFDGWSRPYQCREEGFIRSDIPAEELLGFVHYHADIIDTDRDGAEYSPKATEGIAQLKARIEALT